MSYKNYITEIPDFPIDGVNFKDLSPLLSNEESSVPLVDMGKRVRLPDYWVGVDSRGYIFSKMGLHILVVVLYVQEKKERHGR